jgi:hypothetical protein
MRDAGAKLAFSRAMRTWSLREPWSRPPARLTRAELVALVEATQRDRFAQCNAVWTPGVLHPPGQVRHAGRCQCVLGHAGEHQFPEEVAG